MGCHVLLQGTFPIRGKKWHLLHFLHWQAGSLPLAPSGKSNLRLFPHKRWSCLVRNPEGSEGAAQCIPAPFKMPVLLNKDSSVLERGFIFVRQTPLSSFIIKT